MLQPSQLTKKKFKMIAQMVPIICSGSEKNTKLPLKLPKRTLSTPVQCSVCCCIVVFTHCDRALHCSGLNILRGWVGASPCLQEENSIRILNHINPLQYHLPKDGLTLSFVQSFKTQVDPYVDYLSSECH